MNFREAWLDSVDLKKSVLCAGLDPAAHEMGRGDKGLPEGVDKRSWSLEYVEAIAPYCSALKPNFQYWKDIEDIAALQEINELARSKGLVVIDDSKLADIGSTNEAGMFYSAQRADAVTFSPFAGNLKEAAEQSRKMNIGLITMCLMSNPEFERMKNMLVEVSENDEYRDEEIVTYLPSRLVRQYVQLAHDSRKYGLDGIVIGAPSKKNHLTESEAAKARHYAGDDMLVLCPGVGAQGGEADILWKYFGENNIIVNVGRELMFPNGSKSTPQEQAEKAKYFQEMLNDARH